MSVAHFASRRARLAAGLQLNSVLLVPAAVEITRSRDTEFAFRQDSDFNYLTGFPEPDALLILQKSASGDITELLLCRPKDELAEVWQGRRFGPAAAALQFGLPALCHDVLEQELLLVVAPLELVEHLCWVQQIPLEHLAYLF